jgi:hypothetical protein
MALAPAFAATPYVASASLAAATACTTRAPTAVAGLAAAFIFALVPASTAGVRIDQIRVKGCSNSMTATTAAQTVTIWESDGVTAWPIDEITVAAQAPSTTAPSFQILTQYQNLSIPATHSLWVSTSVTTTASTTALSVTATGGLY